MLFICQFSYVLKVRVNYLKMELTLKRDDFIFRWLTPLSTKTKYKFNDACLIDFGLLRLLYCLTLHRYLVLNFTIHFDVFIFDFSLWKHSFRLDV